VGKQESLATGETRAIRAAAAEEGKGERQAMLWARQEQQQQQHKEKKKKELKENALCHRKPRAESPTPQEEQRRGEGHKS
jgi:hypothetical protein